MSEENPFQIDLEKKPNDGVDLSAEKSIVDTVLNLNDFLSGEIRRAEKVASWYTRADLEAEIETRSAELDSLTDSQGRPLPLLDESLGDGARTAEQVAQEIAQLQKEYAASRVTVRMRQMDEDTWAAFLASHKDVEGPPYPVEFYDDLIVKTAVNPRFTPEQIVAFRAKAGHVPYNELASKAWETNVASGVSIPKSSLSSVVLGQKQRT